METPEDMEKEKQERREKEQRRKEAWDIRPYLAMGASIFIVIALSMILFFFLFRFKGFFQGIHTVIGVLQSVLIGCLIAYLVCPVVNFFEVRIKQPIRKKISDKGKADRVARGVSIFLTLLLVVAIIAVLLGLLIPQLISSIAGLIVSMPAQAENLSNWIQGLSDSDGPLSQLLQEELGNITDYVQNFLQTELPHKIGDIMLYVTSGVINVAKLLMNIVIGFIVSVYVLFDKEKFLGQAKKLIYTIFRPKQGNIIIETARKSHEILIGFIVGKIIDSCIIGVLTFVILYCTNMPYMLLVSVIVGVTNVVPFFGPFIGAVPSTILIMLADPIKGLYFILIILAIQQLDGNVIGPKILGSSTGLSSFWVIVAILLGGGLFGFVGMLVGVPTFAVLYYIVKKIVEYVLQRKKLPIETSDYTKAKELNPDTRELVYEDREQYKETLIAHAWQFWKKKRKTDKEQR